MFSNETDDKYCPECGKIYFFYTKTWQDPFCMCHMKIFLRVDQIEMKMHQHKSSIPHAFYEAFKDEKEF